MFVLFVLIDKKMINKYFKDILKTINIKNMRTVLIGTDSDDLNGDGIGKFCHACSDMRKRIYVEEELLSTKIIENPFDDQDPPYLIVLKYKCNKGLDLYEGDGDFSGEPLIQNYLRTI